LLKIFIVQEEDDEAWKMGIPADVRAEVIERCEEVLKAMRPKNADRVVFLCHVMMKRRLASSIFLLIFVGTDRLDRPCGRGFSVRLLERDRVCTEHTRHQRLDRQRAVALV